MSGWNYPLANHNPTKDWFWTTCTHSFEIGSKKEEFERWFEVQQYVGPVKRLFVSPGTGDGYYRILTKPLSSSSSQYILATANSHEQLLEFVQLLNVEVIPRIKGLTEEVFSQVLPSLIEKLAHQTTLQLLRDWNVLEEDGIHTVDLATIIEGIKCDSLMMSITFEYEYKYPPPDELLCATCKLPAVDPYVSPVFAGKVFCSSCAAFEGGSHFLKANNLASTLDSLEVYCPFASFGCSVIVPRGQLGAHLQECPHVRIVCVNKTHGCNFAAKSKAEAIEHMQFCEFRPSVCNNFNHPLSPPLSPSQPSLPLPPRLLHVGDVINASNARAAAREQASLPKKRRCKLCLVEEEEVEKGKEGQECCYHSGTWSGYTYTQVQEWRFNVWKRRLHKGVKCVIHLPVEIAKSTTALGVGIVSFGALVAGAVSAVGTAFLPEMILAGGFLMVIPSPITSVVVSTVLSPSMFYNLLYKLPYRLLWGKKKKTKKEEEVQEWTCCNKIGSSAEPCEKRGIHSFE